MDSWPYWLRRSGLLMLVQCMTTMQDHYNSFSLKVAASTQPYLLVWPWVLSTDAYFQDNLIRFTFFFLMTLKSWSLSQTSLLRSRLLWPEGLLIDSNASFICPLKCSTDNSNSTLEPLSSPLNLLLILDVLCKEWHPLLPSYPRWRPGNERQSSCPWLGKMWQMGTMDYLFVSGNIKSHELQLYTSSRIALKNSI